MGNAYVLIRILKTPHIMLDKIRQTAIQYYRRPSKFFDLTMYVGFLLFVLILPFGYATAMLNASLLLMLFGWVGRICYERRFEWNKTPLDIPLAVFLLLALVASLLAPHRATSSLGYFWKLLRAVLLFYAVIHGRLGPSLAAHYHCLRVCRRFLRCPWPILLCNRHTHGNRLYVRYRSKIRQPFQRYSPA